MSMIHAPARSSPEAPLESDPSSPRPVAPILLTVIVATFSEMITSDRRTPTFDASNATMSA